MNSSLVELGYGFCSGKSNVQYHLKYISFSGITILQRATEQTKSNNKHSKTKYMQKMTV